jgi:IS5 family transposase
MHQLSFADIEISRRSKSTRIAKTLDKINMVVDWKPLERLVSGINKSGTAKGGRPPLPTEVKLRMLFLQHLYNISDEEIEDQLIDRMSFQKFCLINMMDTIPDFTTFWRFKEAIAKKGLSKKIFTEINKQLEGKGLFVKTGTLVDATILESTTRALSDTRREELAQAPSRQIDTDAHAVKKGGKWYFGYRGHIGVDIGSKLIATAEFTPANISETTVAENLWRPTDKVRGGDKGYFNEERKRDHRKQGIFHAILDRGKRNHPLSNKQKWRNKRLSSVRAEVEHPFAVMKKQLKWQWATKKKRIRNEVDFFINCTLCNIRRAAWLLGKAQT